MPTPQMRRAFETADNLHRSKGIGKQAAIVRQTGKYRVGVRNQLGKKGSLVY